MRITYDLIWERLRQHIENDSPYGYYQFIVDDKRGLLILLKSFIDDMDSEVYIAKKSPSTLKNMQNVFNKRLEAGEISPEGYYGENDAVLDIMTKVFDRVG